MNRIHVLQQTYLANRVQAQHHAPRMNRTVIYFIGKFRAQPIRFAIFLTIRSITFVFLFPGVVRSTISEPIRCAVFRGPEQVRAV